jgi:glycosyltransferase involved in cell wall biosynthesis
LQSNQGVSGARNHGAALSRGQFLAFLDSDDVWQPSKLERQIAFFTAHPEASICQTEEIWLRNGVRVNPHNKHRKVSGDIFARSLELCLVSPSAVMLRRALFEQMGGFDPDLPVCEDYDLWLRIAALMPIHLIDSPFVIKRGGHPDQLSHRFWAMDRFRVAALHKLLDSGVLSDEQRQLSLAVLQKKCAILVQGAKKRGKTGEEYMQLVACYAGER